MSRSKKITQRDVAVAAGVSQGIVSSVLSGRSNDLLSVSDATRNRVMTVANELGYVSRPSVRRRSDDVRPAQVLLVMPPPQRGRPRSGDLHPADSSMRSFIGYSISEIGARLDEHGIGLSIHQLRNDQGLMQWLSESDVRAVIWHTSVGDGALLAWVATRYPVVVMNQAWSSSHVSDGVSVDQRLNVMIPLEHLWERGHRKIAYFGHVTGNPMFEERLSVYHRFVTVKGMRDYREFQEISDEQQRLVEDKVPEILDTWQSLGDEAPTAIVMGDFFALRLMEAAKARGIRIPEDLSVVGIDNLEACAYVLPRLTSMGQCQADLCEAVVERLLKRIHKRDAPTQCVTIAPHLVERDSVHRLNLDIVETSGDVIS